MEDQIASKRAFADTLTADTAQETIELTRSDTAVDGRARDREKRLLEAKNKVVQSVKKTESPQKLSNKEIKQKMPKKKESSKMRLHLRTRHPGLSLTLVATFASTCASHNKSSSSQKRILATEISSNPVRLASDTTTRDQNGDSEENVNKTIPAEKQTAITEPKKAWNDKKMLWQGLDTGKTFGENIIDEGTRLNTLKPHQPTITEIDAMCGVTEDDNHFASRNKYEEDNIYQTTVEDTERENKEINGDSVCMHGSNRAWNAISETRTPSKILIDRATTTVNNKRSVQKADCDVNCSDDTEFETGSPVTNPDKVWFADIGTKKVFETTPYFIEKNIAHEGEYPKPVKIEMVNQSTKEENEEVIGQIKNSETGLVVEEDTSIINGNVQMISHIPITETTPQTFTQPDTEVERQNETIKNVFEASSINHSGRARVIMAEYANTGEDVLEMVTHRNNDSSASKVELGEHSPTSAEDAIEQRDVVESHRVITCEEYSIREDNDPTVIFVENSATEGNNEKVLASEQKRVQTPENDMAEQPDPKANEQDTSPGVEVSEMLTHGNKDFEATRTELGEHTPTSAEDVIEQSDNVESYQTTTQEEEPTVELVENFATTENNEKVLVSEHNAIYEDKPENRNLEKSEAEHVKENAGFETEKSFSTRKEDVGPKAFETEFGECLTTNGEKAVVEQKTDINKHEQSTTNKNKEKVLNAEQPKKYGTKNMNENDKPEAVEDDITEQPIATENRKQFRQNGVADDGFIETENTEKGSIDEGKNQKTLASGTVDPSNITVNGMVYENVSSDKKYEANDLSTTVSEQQSEGFASKTSEVTSKNFRMEKVDHLTTNENDKASEQKAESGVEVCNEEASEMLKHANHSNTESEISDRKDTFKENSAYESKDTNSKFHQSAKRKIEEMSTQKPDYQVNSSAEIFETIKPATNNYKKLETLGEVGDPANTFNKHKQRGRKDAKFNSVQWVSRVSKERHRPNADSKVHFGDATQHGTSEYVTDFDIKAFGAVKIYEKDREKNSKPADVNAAITAVDKSVTRESEAKSGQRANCEMYISGEIRSEKIEGVTVSNKPWATTETRKIFDSRKDNMHQSRNFNASEGDLVDHQYTKKDNESSGKMPHLIKKDISEIESPTDIIKDESQDSNASKVQKLNQPIMKENDNMRRQNSNSEKNRLGTANRSPTDRERSNDSEVPRIEFDTRPTTSERNVIDQKRKTAADGFRLQTSTTKKINIIERNKEKEQNAYYEDNVSSTENQKPDESNESKNCDAFGLHTLACRITEENNEGIVQGKSSGENVSNVGNTSKGQNMPERKALGVKAMDCSIAKESKLASDKRSSFNSPDKYLKLFQRKMANNTVRKKREGKSMFGGNGSEQFSLKRTSYPPQDKNLEVTVSETADRKTMKSIVLSKSNVKYENTRENKRVHASGNLKAEGLNQFTNWAFRNERLGKESRTSEETLKGSSMCETKPSIAEIVDQHSVLKTDKTNGQNDGSDENLYKEKSTPSTSSDKSPKGFENPDPTTVDYGNLKKEDECSKYETDDDPLYESEKELDEDCTQDVVERGKIIATVIEETSQSTKNEASPPHYENLHLETEALPRDSQTDQHAVTRQFEIHPFVDGPVRRFLLFDINDHARPLFLIRFHLDSTFREICLLCRDQVSSGHVCPWLHFDGGIREICLTCYNRVRSNHVCPLLDNAIRGVCLRCCRQVRSDHVCPQIRVFIDELGRHQAAVEMCVRCLCLVEDGHTCPYSQNRAFR